MADLGLDEMLCWRATQFLPMKRPHDQSGRHFRQDQWEKHPRSAVSQ